MALTWVNFFAAGPSTVLVEIVINVFGAYPPDPRNPASLSPSSIAAFQHGVSKAAFLFSATSVSAGVSNLLWVPLAVKYGRRSVYTFTFLAFGLCCIWSARATSYSTLLASKIIASWFAGGAECIAPMTIADLFFLHERGQMTAYVKFSTQLLSLCSNADCCFIGCTRLHSRRVPPLDHSYLGSCQSHSPGDRSTICALVLCSLRQS